MKYYFFLDGKRDRLGQYQALWNTGNYQYEIENRITGEKVVLNDTTCEDAKRMFDALCVSY